MAGDTSNQSQTSLVTTRFNGMIVEVGLNNGRLNLVTRELLRALNTVLSDIGVRTDIRCLILHGGQARAFCAGSDIKEFVDLKANASERKILFEDMVLRRLAQMPMPTIAALDGPALGGGLEIALACELRVSRPDVILGLTESCIDAPAGDSSSLSLRVARPPGGD